MPGPWGEGSTRGGAVLRGAGVLGWEGATRGVAGLRGTAGLRATRGASGLARSARVGGVGGGSIRGGRGRAGGGRGARSSSTTSGGARSEESSAGSFTFGSFHSAATCTRSDSASATHIVGMVILVRLGELGRSALIVAALEVSSGSTPFYARTQHSDRKQSPSARRSARDAGLIARCSQLIPEHGSGSLCSATCSW